MNKEDILAKSREENKQRDLFEQEVLVKAGNAGAIAAAILATIFVIVQLIVGSGMSYGMYAIVFSVPAAGFIVKSIQMKRRREIVLAVIWTIGALVFSIAHIYQLIAASAIL